MSDVTSDYKNKKSAPGSTAISAMGSSTFSVSVGADRTVPLLLDGTDLRKKLRLL